MHECVRSRMGLILYFSFTLEGGSSNVGSQEARLPRKWNSLRILGLVPGGGGVLSR